MSSLALAQRFVDAIQIADVDAARACFHPDAGIWHNYDNGTQSVEENLGLLALMAAKLPKRHYEIHRLNDIDGGYLQHHTLHVTGADGTVVAVEALAMVFVEDDKITGIKEWIDPTPLRPLLAG
ncbi:MAG: nuclear transport factor 2 family protein [Pseudomonadota bacterium]